MNKINLEKLKISKTNLKIYLIPKENIIVNIQRKCQTYILIY